MLCEKQWYTYQYCINNTIKWSKSECALQSHIPVLDTLWFGDHGNVSLRDLQQDKRGARPVSHHILTDVTDPPFYIPCVILWKKKKKNDSAERHTSEARRHQHTPEILTQSHVAHIVLFLSFFKQIHIWVDNFSRESWCSLRSAAIFPQPLTS